MSRQELTLLRDPAEVARVASERFLEAARGSVHHRGRFVVALSGGSTPRLLYRRLTAGPLRLMLPWSRTHVLFGDERYVPPTDEQSNYRMVKEALLDNVRIPAEQIYRMNTHHGDAAVSAADYERRMRGLFAGETIPQIDLLLLGMGQDGHTASLFPESPALTENERWVVANHAAHLEHPRITLTLPVIRAARYVLFLITGENKARTLAECFGGVAHETPYPCELTRPDDGEREILVDLAAARLLENQ